MEKKELHVHLCLLLGFNNQSELGSGVVVSQDGNSIIIPPSESDTIRSTYGDYSCFHNNTIFLNCYSLFLTGK